MTSPERLSGITVVKIGGRSFETETARAAQARAIAEAVEAGAKVVVAHGGGPQVTQALEKAGATPRFVQGLRVTDADVLSAMEPVVAALGKEVAHALTAAGAPAIALTGRDASVLEAEVKDPALGRVGTPTRVNAGLLRHLAYNGVTPVVGPIAVDAHGPLNVNADEVAAALACALHAKRLVLLTDVDGVKDRDGGLLPHLTGEAASALIASGVASAGMVPKLQAALGALHGGVERVHVINGRHEQAIKQALSGSAVGTTLHAGRKLLSTPAPLVTP